MTIKMRPSKMRVKRVKELTDGNKSLANRATNVMEHEIWDMLKSTYSMKFGRLIRR